MRTITTTRTPPKITAVILRKLAYHIILFHTPEHNKTNVHERREHRQDQTLPQLRNHDHGGRRAHGSIVPTITNLLFCCGFVVLETATHTQTTEGPSKRNDSPAHSRTHLPMMSLTKGMLLAMAHSIGNIFLRAFEKKHKTGGGGRGSRGGLSWPSMVLVHKRTRAADAMLVCSGVQSTAILSCPPPAVVSALHLAISLSLL